MCWDVNAVGRACVVSGLPLAGGWIQILRLVSTCVATRTSLTRGNWTYIPVGAVGLAGETMLS